MKRRVFAVAAAIAAVTAGAAAFYRTGSDAGTPAFTTAAVTRGAVVESVEATGIVQAVTTVEVGTQVSGTIKALHVDYNAHVKRGQIVAQLEPSLFETQVEQARATVQRLQADVERAQVALEDARVKLRRARELSARELVPAIDLETAESTARQAEASLKAAQAQLVQGRAALRNNEVNLGHTTIRSPIDGIVISRNVDVGQTVAASMSAPTLFVLAQDLRHMQVNARVDESDIGRIHAGQDVRFRVDAYPDTTFIGTVTQVRLEPVVEQNVVSYVTVIDVPNPDLKLKPGMTANVTIELARADDVLRVPTAALRFEPPPDVLAAGSGTSQRSGAAGDGGAPARSRTRSAEAAGVWVLRGGRLGRVPVRTGISDGTAVAVAGDLRAGDLVVTAAPAAAQAATRSTSPLLPQRPSGSRARQGGSR